MHFVISEEMGLQLIVGYLCCLQVFIFCVVSGEKRLQIGVKKRVDSEDCKIKSRKYDILHIHYTVSDNCFQFLCHAVRSNIVYIF